MAEFHCTDKYLHFEYFTKLQKQMVNYVAITQKVHHRQKFYRKVFHSWKSYLDDRGTHKQKMHEASIYRIERYSVKMRLASSSKTRDKKCEQFNTHERKLCRYSAGKKKTTNSVIKANKTVFRLN